MGAYQKALVRSCPLQCQQQVGQVWRFKVLDWSMQVAAPGECLQQRSDVVGQWPVIDPRALESKSGQHVEIEMRRNSQISRVLQDCANQSLMVQNLVPGFSVGKKINQTYCIGLVSRESADDKVEIFSGKACPTVRLNHRLFINSTTRARNEEKSAFSFPRFWLIS